MKSTILSVVLIVFFSGVAGKIYAATTCTNMVESMKRDILLKGKWSTPTKNVVSAVNAMSSISAMSAMSFMDVAIDVPVCAYIENNTLVIKFVQRPVAETVYVRIADKKGKVIFEDYYFVRNLKGMQVSVKLPEIKGGSVLEILAGNDCWQGEF